MPHGQSLGPSVSHYRVKTNSLLSVTRSCNTLSPKTSLFILKSPLHDRYVPLLPLVFLRETLGYTCLPVKECSREWQAFWRFKKANPQGSSRGQKHHAHFKAWVKPLIERPPPSKHPLSPASDVTGHFHTPTLFNTLLLVLHWSCVGRNPHTGAGSSVSYSYGCFMATRPKILWEKNNIWIVAVETVEKWWDEEQFRLQLLPYPIRDLMKNYCLILWRITSRSITEVAVRLLSSFCPAAVPHQIHK